MGSQQWKETVQDYFLLKLAKDFVLVSVNENSPAIPLWDGGCPAKLSALGVLTRCFPGKCVSDFRICGQVAKPQTMAHIAAWANMMIEKTLWNLAYAPLNFYKFESWHRRGFAIFFHSRYASPSLASPLRAVLRARSSDAALVLARCRRWHWRRCYQSPHASHLSLWVGFTFQTQWGKPAYKNQADSDPLKSTQLLNPNSLLGRDFSRGNISRLISKYRGPRTLSVCAWSL